jgi:DNA-damage-inducible protein J
MNKTAVVSARIAPEVKSKAEKILNELGLTTTEAITMLFQQINLRQGIPFPIEIPNAETMSAIRELPEYTALTNCALKSSLNERFCFFQQNKERPEAL